MAPRRPASRRCHLIDDVDAALSREDGAAPNLIVDNLHKKDHFARLSGISSPALLPDVACHDFGWRSTIKMGFKWHFYLTEILDGENPRATPQQRRNQGDLCNGSAEAV
jgi:hypothetical protein